MKRSVEVTEGIGVPGGEGKAIVCHADEHKEWTQWLGGSGIAWNLCYTASVR
jgi:hypothetical protein